MDLSPAHIHAANLLALDVPALSLLDNLPLTLYTASTSSFWTDRFLFRTQSYQRRGALSPFHHLLLERISPGHSGESPYNSQFICYNVLRIHLPNKQSEVSDKTTSAEKGGIHLDRFRL